MKHALSRLASAFVLAGTLTASNARAEFFEDMYLYPPENPLKQEMSAIREDLRQQEKPDIADDYFTARHCIIPPLPAKDWELLAARNEADITLFYDKLGQHLGLGGTFDILNPYHRMTFYARTKPADLRATWKSTFDGDAAKTNKIKEKFAVALTAALVFEADFWPPEMKKLSSDDLDKVLVNGDPLTRKLLSDLVTPRAKWKLQMLRDRARICDPSLSIDDRKAASARYERYLTQKP